MSAPITVRDRRDLPFFMVRARALQEIRNHISGPRRARALGLYVLLCQIANEQRANGEHQRLVATREELARRGALSKSMLKALAVTLEAAGTARFETRVDPLRGSMPGLIHLDVHDGPWVGLTVAAAQRLSEESRALLPTLGLFAVLLELCAEQRVAMGGLCAETTRADVARRVGASTDTLDSWVKALEGADVLNVTRRRGSDGGHLPNLWEIREPYPASERTTPNGSRSEELTDRYAPDELRQAPGRPSTTTPAENGNHHSRRTKPPWPEIRTTHAENRNDPSRDQEPPRPRSSRPLAENGNCPAGISATPRGDPRPLNARAGSAVETPTKEERLNPQTPDGNFGRGGVGEGGDREEARLCLELVGVLSESRGPAPARRYASDATGWHAAARRVLADHSLAKVLEAVAYLPFDQVIGTKVRGMPDLERHIEDLRHRAHAAKALVAAGRSPVGAGGGLSWPEAKAELLRAVQRHGAGAKAAALEDLGRGDGLLARFVAQVGWGALCQSPIEKQDYAYRVAWDALARQSVAEEAA